ncbi:MAG: response regulator [Proteobacteria bacterium]|nr:response regulator [Pseudomonadota bacterium]
MKILLFDKQKNYRLTTRKLLSKQGHNVLTAARWSEALQKMERHIIHVVILGVQLADGEGIAALKQIKSRFPLVQTIILAEPDAIDIAMKGLELGAADYLIKPAGIEEIVQKVEESLDRRRRLEQKIRAAQIEVLERQFINKAVELNNQLSSETISH